MLIENCSAIFAQLRQLFRFDSEVLVMNPETGKLHHR